MITLTDDQITQIKSLLRDSPVYGHRWWEGQGHAPENYLLEVLYAFAIDVQNPGPVITAPIVVNPTMDRTDVLSWYHSNLVAAGVDQQSALIQVYTILMGLAMPESSGDFCCGADSTAVLPETMYTAETGAFQVSYGACIEFPDVLVPLFQEYKGRSDFTCHTQNVGSGDGQEFQRLSKECPEFACRFAARLLRLSGGFRGEWGTLRRKVVEVVPAVADLLASVQKVITG